MDIKSFLSENGIKYCENEPMNLHCSFKIGGNADIFIAADSTETVVIVKRFCYENNIPLTVLGNGSNVLISDEGIPGVVLTLGGMNRIKVENNTVICEAGATLCSLCCTAADSGLSGFEFAYGIPGSVGGAVFMNAGAYGGEIKNIIKYATVLTADGEIIQVSAEDMQLSYRTSVFKENGSIILNAEFELKPDNPADIKERMNGFIARRKEKQPLDYPSAGSTFKRPEGNFAGTLIEKSGLKGYSVGGAMVSEKHAGFIINYNKAGSKDIKRLIKAVQDKVYKDSGIMLEREIIYIGREEQ